MLMKVIAVAIQRIANELSRSSNPAREKGADAWQIL